MEDKNITIWDLGTTYFKGEYHVPQWIQEIKHIDFWDQDVLNRVTWKMLKKYIRKRWRKFKVIHRSGAARPRPALLIERPSGTWFMLPMTRKPMVDHAYVIKEFVETECKERKINQIELLAELLSYE